MSRNNTGNPIDSKAFPDFEDNVKNLDLAVNSQEDSWEDRFRVGRMTLSSMERAFTEAQGQRSAEFDADQAAREAVFSDFLQASGYQDLGEYAPGIEITAHNQYVTFGGQPYLLKPSIPVPYTTSGEWTGDDFRLIGDDSLRQDLANPGIGAAMVARGVVGVDSIADLLALPEGQRKEGLRYLVKGYYAGSDVGGGEFCYESGRTAENNGVTVFDGFVRILGSRTTTLYDAGGIADYAGIALYDGSDSGRITATDNTVAFARLVTEAIQSGRECIKIPAGHWGIKTGQLLFSGFTKLRIVGDGIGATTLDFINEYAPVSGGGYVDETMARCIAHFDGGDELEFADILVKATTKGGVVNGAPGSGHVYQGAVWGFKIQDVKTVRFTRARAERFNYRGFSVYGAATERVNMQHCEGFHNVGSGFWVADADLFKVIGGEFAYNGIKTDMNTGYGVTGSVRIGKMLVKRGHYHHNYRKGVDSHGVRVFSCKGATFEDNVFSQIAVPDNEAVSDEKTVEILYNKFAVGRTDADRAWLRDILATRVQLGNSPEELHGTMLFSVSDRAGYENTTRILIKGNTLSCLYNFAKTEGVSKVQAPMVFQCANAELIFEDNNLNFEGFEFIDGNNIWSHALLRTDCKKLVWNNNTLKCLADGDSAAGGFGKSTFMSLYASGPVDLSMDNNRIYLNNLLFISGGASTSAHSPVNWSVSGSRRDIRNNLFSWVNDPFQSGTWRTGDDYFFGKLHGPGAPVRASNNTFVRAGSAYMLPEPHFGITNSECAFEARSINKAAGADTLAIILDRQHAISIRIQVNNAPQDLVITFPLSTFGGAIHPYVAGHPLQYSSHDANHVEDGTTKLRVVLKVADAFSGNLYGTVRVSGALPGLGIERIDSI